MRADLKEWMLKTSEELQGLGNKVLLWTNPSPTAAFGAQTVISNTDLTIYDEIEIYYAGNTGYPDCVHVVKQPANTNSYIFGSSNSLTARNVVITGNSLSFGKGIRYAYAGNGSDDNAQLIPQKIYGVIIGATGGGGSGGGTSDYEDLENKPTINGVTLVEGLVTEDLNLGDTAHEEISQADFDALTSEEQNDGTVYFITDGVASNVFVDDNVPVGTIAPYGGSNDPAYWLICDGRAISRTAYSELFSVIGTTYGIGDGSTTFNIPDLRGNVAVGASTTLDLGDTGGEAEHTLTVDELPAHSHYMGAGGWNGNAGYLTGNASNALFGPWDYGTNNTGAKNSPTRDTGGDQPHNNMQPYVVTNYIIKAKTALSENQSQLDFFYPVGSYYETSDSTFNPNSRWGGTWENEGIISFEDKELLWSNSSGSYLASINISLNTDKYDFIDVYVRGNVTTSSIQRIEANAKNGTILSTYDSYITGRDYTLTATSLSFGDGYYFGSYLGSSQKNYGNGYGLPYYIYGIIIKSSYKWHRVA